MTTHTLDQLTYPAIAVGILIPIVYYGIQPIAILFARDYDIVRQVASELGMVTVSSRPAVYNIGRIVGSIPTWIAAVGFPFGLTRMGTRPLPTWLTTVGMICIAMSTVQAGIFPLPDPRHEGVFLIGFPVWSLSLIAAARSLPDSGAFRIYLTVNFALSILMLVARGVVGEQFFSPIAGLFQRLFALVTVVPIGVAAWFLARRLKRFALQ
ncbi:MAG: DUF998 domain-containing protein [Gemmatimonadetes bacterium]|nr:DUF998 domain-containing protein [Gemmatimonadota bacterium]MBL0178678.1 DUF998 domain-containing protein [Gemmatimonadota bacterium]